MNSKSSFAVDTVTQAYPRTPLCVEPTSSIRSAMVVLREASRGCLLVCVEKRLVGIFTERDALRLMAIGTDYDQPVESVMQRSVATVQHDDILGDAIARMAEGGYRRLPILNNAGEPIGILTVKTILRYLVEHFPGVVYTLPPEPHYVTHLREGA